MDYCPVCKKELSIIHATHVYDITLCRPDDWSRDEGSVEYKCGHCEELLSTNEIEDILKQVDEL